MEEHFEAAAPEGWTLLPGAVVMDGILSCSDLGHGVWVATFPEDFVLSARYRHAQGIGQVVFHFTGDLPTDNDYRLRFNGASAVLARCENGQETILQSKACALQAGAWHDLVIKYTAGQVTLTVDGKGVLEVTDPTPLPNGILAFGSVGAQGVGFDDITVSEPPAAQTAMTESFADAQPQGWVLLPGAMVMDGTLVCNDLGHGVWMAAFPEDFLLSLRYKQGQGIGQVVFHFTGNLPTDNDYRLRFSGTSAVLARCENGQEKILKATALALTAGTWHDVVITCKAGKVTLTVDGKGVLEVTDPSPLPNGVLAFGSVNAQGVAFDDVAVGPAP